MGICTLILTIFMEVGCCKKRKKVGEYKKPKLDNSKKLNLYLTKIEQLKNIENEPKF
mgnify:CR=1 FL=1